MLQTDVGSSWFEKIKETVNADAWLAELDLSAGGLMQAGLYGAVGFFVGFALKKYGKLFLLLSLFCIVVLFSFYYFNVITFDFFKLKELVGIAPTVTFQNFFQSFYAWLRDNKMLTVSSLTGFVIGYLVG